MRLRIVFTDTEPETQLDLDAEVLPEAGSTLRLGGKPYRVDNVEHREEQGALVYTMLVSETAEPGEIGVSMAG